MERSPCEKSLARTDNFHDAGQLDAGEHHNWLLEFACSSIGEAASVHALLRPLIHGAKPSQKAKVRQRSQNDSGSMTRNARPARSLRGVAIAKPYPMRYGMRGARRLRMGECDLN
jgi:hypothetical protein